MAIVYRPVFGKKRTEVSSTPSTQAGESLEEKLALDLLFYRESEENRAYIQSAEAAGARLTLYIFELLQGFQFSHENLALRRDALQSKSFEELCTLLVDSNESMWEAHPHFYGAAFVEYDERKKAILSLETSSGLPPAS